MTEFARLSNFEVAPGRTDDAVAFFAETDLGGASDAGGFRRAFWLLDRSSGKGVELVIFDSKDAMDAAAGDEAAARSKASSSGITMSAEQSYEVVAEGRPVGELAPV